MSSSKKSKKKLEPTDQYSLSRYLWIGAGLGIYFGWIFRPIRPEPSWILPLWLGVVITLAMLALKYIPRSRPPASTILPYAIKTYVSYTIILFVLESRHPVYHWGGKSAVMVMTTVMGMLSGWWYLKFNQRGNSSA